MSKHTPGPWRVFAGTGFDYLGIEAENYQTVVIYGLDGDDGGIRGLTHEEAEANAHLIASSPKLLEALKRFVDVCDNGNPIDIFNALGSCVEPARQAIAKAEGK